MSDVEEHQRQVTYFVFQSCLISLHGINLAYPFLVEENIYHHNYGFLTVVIWSIAFAFLTLTVLLFLVQTVIHFTRYHCCNSLSHINIALWIYICFELSCGFSFLTHSSHSNALASHSRYTVFLYMIPILFSSTIDKDYRSSNNQNPVSLLLWFVSVLFLITGALSMKSSLSDIYSIILGSVSSLIVISELYFHHADLMYFKEQLPIAEMVIKNEMSAKYAEELRHMIGNFAHDLKTPLAGLKTSVDLLSSSISDSHINRSANSLCMSLEECLESLNVNYFIVLTVINRYIDYVKAKKSVKLVPYIQSFSIKESLEIPLSYLKTILDTTQVTLPQWTPELTCEIQSDKQWIYENLLGMLLNSTKFCSNLVNVEIGISVIDSTVLFDLKNCQANNFLFFGYDDVDKNHDQNTTDSNRSSSSLFRKSNSFLEYTFSSRGASLRRFNSIFPYAPQNKSLPQTSLKQQPAGNQRYVKFEVRDNGVGLSKEVLKTLFQVAGSTEQACIHISKPHENISNQDMIDSKEAVIRPVIKTNMPTIGEVAVQSITDAPFDFTSTASFTDHHSSHHNTSSINESQHDQVQLPTVPVPESDTSNALKILIVEDSPSLLKITSKSLRQKGNDVEVATDGKQAVDLFAKLLHENEDEDHVVSNGLKDYKKLLLIAYSANSDPQTREDSFSSGADYFLPKPIQIKDLFSIYEKYSRN
eukprot:gene10736-14420_t